MPLSCQNTPTSTIVQLLYTAPQQLEFDHLLSQLKAALADNMPTQQQFNLVRNDLAILDTPTGRLTLSLQTGLTGAHDTCLTLGVGNGPDEARLGDAPDTGSHTGSDTGPNCKTAPANIAGQQTTLARRLTTAICTSAPVDQTLWHIVPQVVTADIIDTLAHKLPEIAHREVETSEPKELPRILRQVEETLKKRGKATDTADIEEDDTSSILTRLGLMGGARPGVPVTRAADKQPAPAPAITLDVIDPVLVPANDIPQVPTCDLTELQQVRQALYGFARSSERSHISIQMGLGSAQGSNLVIYLPFADKAGRAIKRMDRSDLARGARALAIMGTVSGLPNMVEAANMIGLV